MSAYATIRNARIGLKHHCKKNMECISPLIECLFELEQTCEPDTSSPDMKVYTFVTVTKVYTFYRFDDGSYVGEICYRCQDGNEICCFRILEDSFNIFIEAQNTPTSSFGLIHECNLNIDLVTTYPLMDGQSVQNFTFKHFPDTNCSKLYLFPMNIMITFYGAIVPLCIEDVIDEPLFDYVISSCF